MSYTELVRTIRAGRGGEFVSKNPDAISPVYLKSFINCTLENDAWETEKGTRKLNSVAITGAPTIGTVFQYFPTPGQARLVCCGRDGTIWKSSDDGIGWTLLRSGMQPNKLAVPLECGQETAGAPKKLIIFGMGQPVVLVGDATTDAGLATPTAPPGVTVKALSGAMTIGDHYYGYTLLNTIGETALSPTKLVSIPNGNNARTDVVVPTGPAGTTSRKVYRSKAGETTLFLLTTVSGNGVSTYEDNTPDSELGTAKAPPSNGTATIHVLTRPPADWTGDNYPIAGFLLEGRPAGFGNNNGLHFLYVGSRSDHEDFLSSPLTFSVFSGKGEGLSAGVYWRQQGWLFKKPRGIYRIDTSSLNVNEWQVKEHSDAVGCAGPMALILVQGADQSQIFDDVIFLGPDGSWHRLSKTGAYQEGDINASSISETTYGPFIRENVDISRLPFAQMIYFDSIEEVWAAVSQKGAAVNNLRIKANLKRLPEFGMRFHHSTFPECEGLALGINADGSRGPLAGGSGGFVKRMNENLFNDAGVGYDSEFWTHDDNFQDLGEEHKLAEKNYHGLVVEAESLGDWDLTVEVYIDGVKVPTELRVSMLGKASAQFVLDRSRLDKQVLGSRKRVFTTKRLRGRGHRISFRGLMRASDG